MPTGPNGEYAAFSKLRDESVNLGQQLRELLLRFCQSSPAHDECPLCHTKFEESELKRKIATGVDAGF